MAWSRPISRVHAIYARMQSVLASGSSVILLGGGGSGCLHPLFHLINDRHLIA